MFEQATGAEREMDVMMDLRKSVDELCEQIKELNHKLPKSYVIDDAVKSLHKLVQAAETGKS